MSTATATIEERVAKGAALMDEKVPGWHERIDVGRLRMNWCPDCVIGQTFARAKNNKGFSDATKSLGLHSSNEISAHGFDAVMGNLDTTTEYADLRAAWLAEITRRINRNNRMEAKS